MANTNSHLSKYISETLRDLHNKQEIDFDREANLIIDRLLNPNYRPKNAPASKRNYTKVESYTEFQAQYGDIYQKVYSALADADMPLSRSELANRTGMRLSTICGRIAELSEMGAVSVVGTKIDSDTRRKVELLAPILRDNNEG